MRKVSKVGLRFGRLLVVEELDSRPTGNSGRMRIYVKAVCDCGKTIEVPKDSIIKYQSCGCLRVEVDPNALKYHKKYSTWSHMKERCYRKENKKYHNYGGRGIIVEEPWHSDPRSFLDWYDANCNGDYKLQIDRIDIDGNYSPANCRLTSAKENNRNRSNNKLYTAFGEEAPLATLVEKYGKAEYCTVQERLKRDWDIEKALIVPPGVRAYRVKDKSPRKSLYECLNRLQQRCTNANHHAYHRYGGRGITVCEEWNKLSKFENFYNWAIENGWAPGLHLDRIDNNKGYSPDNCRWISPKENNNNKEVNNIYTYKETTSTLSNLVDLYSSIPYGTVYKRLQAGWTIEQALETPLKQ